MTNEVTKLENIFNKLLEMAKEDEMEAEAVSQFVDEMLEEMLGCDFFGTEGQNDPRGDNRK